MSSKHLVDPELLEPLIENFPPIVLTDDFLPIVRNAMAENMQLVDSLPEGVERIEKMIPGPEGAADVRVLVYRPANGSGEHAAYLHIHGGGYVLGMPEMGDVRNISLVDALNCVIVSVDYRLAPEHAFPAPLEDCYAALGWMHRNALELGIDANRIALGGESAGGGLAAGLALLARDRGEFSVLFQLLVYPMIDDRTVTRIEAAPNPLVGEFVWTNNSNRYGWAAYLGRDPGADGVPAHAAPARAADLNGLPPTFLCVGTLDLFLGENIDYVSRLIQAAVPTEFRIYPGAPHGFQVASNARVSQDFDEDYIRVLRRAFDVSA